MSIGILQEMIKLVNIYIINVKRIGMVLNARQFLLMVLRKNELYR